MRLLLILLVLCSGCAGLRPQRGGKASAKLPAVGLSARTQAEAMEVSMHQPENPSQSATQTIKRITETVAPTAPQPVVATQPAASPVIVQQPAPQPAPVVLRQTEEITTTIGAAQKDVSREITAKLASARWVQVLGVLMIIAGCATFHPVVKMFVQSKTVTAALFACGVLLVFLPFVVVGNEILLSIVGIGSVVGLLVYYLGQRNGHHKAIVTTYTTPHSIP